MNLWGGSQWLSPDCDRFYGPNVRLVNGATML